MDSLGAGGEHKPHAVCVPFPAQGHVNPMLKLAKLLHSKGFHITFLHTEHTYHRILATRGPGSLDGLPDFRFETIPDGLPPSGPDSMQDTEALCLAIRTKFADPFRELLKKLDGPSLGVPPVSCIVSDCIMTFTLEVAAELGIPDVAFNPSGVCGYVGCLYFNELLERGLVPLKSEDDLTNGYLDTPVDFIPGMSNVYLKDIPTFVRTTDPDDIIFNFLRDEIAASSQATAIISNTLYDLERPLIDAMSSILPPVYTVGPLSLFSRQVLDSPLQSIGANLWREDSSCMEWLDGRDPNSVIYVNFGSSTNTTNKQLEELAWGLANSGHDFLWVIRPDLVVGEAAVLPEEFVTETKGRSLLTTWCPQEEVLMHPSVGGFLTHCGWNSTLESIGYGVPMICWPYFADQMINCHYLCTEWGIGMEIGSNVKREEVEVTIRELMEGEKGKEMRRRALEWKDNALRATKPSGQSFMNLDKVIQEALPTRKQFP